jgi:hypothetical protein
MWTNNNNNAAINNYGRLQEFILLFRIPTGRQKNFFEIHRQFGQASSGWFASPGPRPSGCALVYRQPQFAVSSHRWIVAVCAQ